ncbi:MAG TPA: hypothetical protein VNZ43_05600 [Sphingomonadaceae bacterium]|nr:hypothetical protein [Sphingomonadaceae bacterium]
MATDAYDGYHDDPPPAEPKRRSRWLGPMILLVIAFGGGAVGMGYILTHWSVATRYLAPPIVIPPPPPAEIMPAPRGTPMTPTQHEAIDRRITDLEARLNRIDVQAAAAEGNADRAEGLLVAFAARRALDRGIQLGYIEALLRARFGTTQPRAVATIIAAGRQPVTLDELKAELSELSPSLISAAPDESWWTTLRRELAGLIVIRQRGTPSPLATERLARARLQLEAGHVGAAIAEVARLPGHERAAKWIALARRYAAARDALDVIETAALLAPHERPAPSPQSSPDAAPPDEAAPPAAEADNGA